MLIYKGEVQDVDLTSPPGSPVEGDMYVVASVATGDWGDYDYYLATYSGSAWTFQVPQIDWKVWAADDYSYYVYTGEKWIERNSVAEYLPEGIRDGDFWQTITPLIDKLISDVDPEIRRLSAKFNSVTDYDEEVLAGLIDEMGYGYIVDILELTEEHLHTLVNFLPLIHYLKGSRAGLELVFRLVGVDITYLKEWWELDYEDICEIFGTKNSETYVSDLSDEDVDEEEDEIWGLYTPLVEPDTFFLSLTIPSSILKGDTREKIKTFCRNYVYPKLARLRIKEGD